MMLMMSWIMMMMINYTPRAFIVDTVFNNMLTFSFQHSKAQTAEFSSEKDNNQVDSSSDQENEDVDFGKSASDRTKMHTGVMEHYLKERTSVTTSDTSISDNDSFEECKSTGKSVLRRTFTVKGDDVAGKQQPLLLSFPSEITLKIFSHLGPKDLCQSAQVCRLWSQAAKDGELWRELYPVRWIFKKDWRFGADSEDTCTCNCDAEIQAMDSSSLSR